MQYFIRQLYIFLTIYFFEDDVQIPEILHDLRNDLPFLNDNLETQKAEKLLPTLNDKDKHVMPEEV